MSDRLVPANPADVTVVREVTPNLTTLSLPFSRFGRFEIGGRCTVARMTGGGVLVFSPTALTPEAAAVVARLGGEQGVRYLVAPDVEHHIFLSEWRAAYPAARVVAPQGLFEKRAATAAAGKDPRVAAGEAPFFAVLADRRPGPQSEPQAVAADFDADFGLAYLDIHPNKEIVLLYRRDSVLLQADLLFNLPAVEQYARVDPASRRGGPDHPNLGNRLFQAVMRAEHGDPTWARRFQWYGASRANRARFNETIRVIDRWPFDAMIPCHGETITHGAKAVFRKIFAWHLPDDKQT